MTANGIVHAEDKQALEAILRVTDVTMLKHLLSHDNSRLLRDVKAMIQVRTNSPEKAEFFNSRAGKALFELTLREYILDREQNPSPATVISSAELEIIQAATFDGKSGEKFMRQRLAGSGMHSADKLSLSDFLNLPEVRQVFIDNAAARALQSNNPLIKAVNELVPLGPVVTKSNEVTHD
jgi:hypothetical protein